MNLRILLPALLIPVAATGCVASISATAAPILDTTGHFGADARMTLEGGFGTDIVRFHMGFGAGGGHIGRVSAPCSLFVPELGIEGGRDVIWSATGFYKMTLLFDRTAHSLYGAGSHSQVLFRVATLGRPRTTLFLGPRISAEGIFGDPEGKGPGKAVGIFLVGLTLRWNMFTVVAD